MEKIGWVRTRRTTATETARSNRRNAPRAGIVIAVAGLALVCGTAHHHGLAASFDVANGDVSSSEAWSTFERSASSSEAAPDQPLLSLDPNAPEADLGHELRFDQEPNSSGGPDSPTTSEPPGGEPEILEDALPGSSSEKTGASSQAIQAPKGAGTIEGMGESFSMQLSTGVGTFSVPIAMPAARGGAQPSLSLSYSSSTGWGIAGMGWDVGVPFIARQTDRGIPGYDDRNDFHFGQDRFVFNGGQELVPICKVTGASRTCTGAQPGEVMPPWSEDSQYFRARVEGSFLRFFWSRDHATWRVQDKSGVTMEFGVPLDGSGYRGGLEVDPENTKAIYRWNLVRQYDTQGSANPSSPSVLPSPVNVVVYRYANDGGASYLTDLYDTTPSAAATTQDLKAYAHHTRLVYEDRPDTTTSYKSGWLVERRRRLARIDVTSKTFEHGTGRNRQLVRRYHLAYENIDLVSLLKSVTLEGRCHASENSAAIELGDGTLPSTSCQRLPPMTLGYTPYSLGGSVQDMASSPPHSVDETLSDLFDVNSDALPDVLVTAPGKYGAGHAVFFNSPGGAANTFGEATRIGVLGVNGGNANTIRLSNTNVAPLDLDGDATIDLLHMPVTRSYSVYTPRLVGANWNWEGRSVDTPDGLSPKIDLGRDALETRVLDVNFDGLVDVVRTTGTEIQTFLALGRYPGGNGRFGTGAFRGKTSATLSSDPLKSCIPWSGTPVRFGDREIQLADLNGDGLQDIVRLQRGAVRYWPGRGNGFWGTGARASCKAGTFGQDRHVLMDASPQFSDLSGTSLRLDDVNGDGLDDILQVRFDAVDVWLNDDGKRFFAKQTLSGTPKSPSFASRVRLVDVNGSGTRDILWANGSRYQYMDLLGGSRPFLLNRVANGLGKTTDLEYGTSTGEMLAAACGGKPFKTVIPTVVHVVKRVTESDNLKLFGTGPSRHVVEYSYRDPLWDGRQREFRGFASASTRRLGDANSPTDLTDSSFLLGECVESVAGGTTCREPSLDNPREALKGLPLVTEHFNEQGVYLSTEVASYRLRPLYQGRDGRVVQHAFEAGSQTTLYDTYAGPSPSVTDVPTQVVLIENQTTWTFDQTYPFSQPSGLAVTVNVPRRATSGHATLKTESVVDPFGNLHVAVNHGCANGTSPCPTSDVGLDAEERINSFSLPGRPTGDETGWLHRTVETFVNGSLHTEKRGRTFTTYNSKGNPTTTTAALTGIIPLWRSHENQLAVASPPSPRSQDGIITLSQVTYDDFGNVTEERGANGRCRRVSHETAMVGGAGPIGFAQLPTSESIFVLPAGSTSALGDCLSGTELKSTANYDRGLGKVTLVTDPAVQPTYATYDSFGRVSSVTKPPFTTEEWVEPASVSVQYDLATSSRPYSIITTSTRDDSGLDPSTPTYLTAQTYVDGMGRTRLVRSEADPAGGLDEKAYIDSEVVTFDAKGAVARKYLPYFTDGTSAPAQWSGVRYDAFGREVELKDLDGTITLENRYHALSVDAWDAADREEDEWGVFGAHYGTYASVRKDGHGRVVATTERIHEDGTLRSHEVRSRYLPTGEVETITRVRVGTSTPALMRWMRYDSLGRMVLNVDPHTTIGFTDNYNTVVTTDLRAWRYAYNDAGDLVGSSDARGCGVNYFYDGAGRLIAEDYSPCVQEHLALPPYSTANLATRDGIEVYYQYDAVPSSFSGLQKPAGYDDDSPLLKGKLAAVFDRASLNYFTYDVRGRVIRTDRAIAHPDIQLTNLSLKYQAPWFSKTQTYDALDRAVTQSTGAASPELLDASQKSEVSVEYSQRGTVKRVLSTYGTLISSIKRAADGLITETTYGDLAMTKATQSYDARRRLEFAEVDRSAPSAWTTQPPPYQPAPSPEGPPTFQLTLRHNQYQYDVVGNPTVILDFRTEGEWPDGAKPVSRHIAYDNLYRVRQVTYDYSTPSTNDTWVSPFEPERTGSTDPRRPTDFPAHLLLPTRVNQQTYEYDWLGSLTNATDDLNAFWDRGLGPIRNNSDGRPYRWEDAGDYANPSWNGTGWADAVEYDAAGNLKQISVSRGGASCTNGSATCELRFYYYFDEVGRLFRGTRYEGLTLKADLFFTYDSDDSRIIKSDVTLAGTVNDVHSLYVFDTLDLRRTGHDAGTSTYARAVASEVPYLVANGVPIGRVVYEGAADGEPRFNGASPLHVFLNVNDHLGSTSIVIDRATSELVEHVTFQPHGGTESDYRPARWKGFREDYRFTGKEEDVEIGLTYFGKRFLSPYLGRWLTPDPLAVHAPGEADLNLYAYVHGQLLRAIDPFGLQDTGGVGNEPQKGSVGTGTQPGDPKQEPSNPTDFTRFDPSSRSHAVAAGIGMGTLATLTPVGVVELHVAMKDLRTKLDPDIYDAWLDGVAMGAEATSIAALQQGVAAGGAASRAGTGGVVAGSVVATAAAGIALNGQAILRIAMSDRGKGTGPVQPGDTGSYRDLRAQKRTSGETEPLDMDHQPSYAAQRKAAEQALGRPLTPSEARALRESTPAVASPRAVHQRTSPTYGWRNKPGQIADDAKDLAAAQARDRAAFDKAMKNR